MINLRLRNRANVARLGRHARLARQSNTVQIHVDLVHRQTTANVPLRVALPHELRGQLLIDALQRQSALSRVHDHRDPRQRAAGRGGVLSEERIGRTEVAGTEGVVRSHRVSEGGNGIVVGPLSGMLLLHIRHVGQVLGLEIGEHGELHGVGRVGDAVHHVVAVDLEVVVVAPNSSTGQRITTPHTRLDRFRT